MDSRLRGNDGVLGLLLLNLLLREESISVVLDEYGRKRKAQREYGGERRRRRSYAEVAKGNTKIVWQRLEAVFMRLAGHKWLGRRMGAACRCFCFVWFVWAEGKLV